MSHLLAFVVASLAADVGRVAGTIVDPNGKPVAGALVLVLQSFRSAPDPLTARTDSEGRFAFEKVERTARRWWDHPVVVAHQPGFAIALAGLSEETPDQAPESLTIRLQPATKVSVKILDPDGKPFTGASAGLGQIGSGGTNVHDENVFARHFSFPLTEGVAVIDLLPEIGVFSFRVQSAELGTQVVRSFERTPEITATLRRPGKVIGRVIAADPAAAKGLKGELVSLIRDESSPRKPSVQGFASFQTDDSGRFEVPALAAGNIIVRVHPNESLPFRFKRTEEPILEPGETKELTIELVRAVLVKGSVVDHETAKPIPGADIFLNETSIVSDERGEFQALAVPGNVMIHFPADVGLYLKPMIGGIQIGADQPEHRLEPIRLRRGRVLSGIVKDANGHPVAKAIVNAAWQDTDASGQLSSLGQRRAIAGEDGRFEMKPLPVYSDIGLSALTTSAATAEPVIVSPLDKASVVLNIGPENVAPLIGRIADTEGKPVVGAWIRLSKAIKIPSGRIYGSSFVGFGSAGLLHSDNQGDFRTPHGVPRSEQYMIRVEADGMLAYESSYVTPAKTGPVRLDNVILEREASVSGIVVDEKGEPVAGATVWSHGPNAARRASTRPTTTTSGDGRFQLNNLHPSARLVFAEKAGHEHSGALMPAPGKDARIVLPAEGSSAEPLKSIRRPPEEQGRLLAALVKPILPSLREVDKENPLVEALSRLGRFDHEFVLDQIKSLGLDSSKTRVFLALGEVDAGLAFTAFEQDRYMVTFHHIKAADAVADPDRKKKLLTKALAAARTIEQSDKQAALLGRIAERFYRAGEIETARKIVDEGRKQAAALPDDGWSGYARGCFAEALAFIDPNAALDMLEKFKDPEKFSRHAGNIAHKLAKINPDESERFLKLVVGDFNIAKYSTPVCYRMAQVAPDRAKMLADAVRAHADKFHAIPKLAETYGAMAMALMEKNPSEAKKLLQKAFELLRSAPPQYRSHVISFPVALLLVGYSETVDPGRTRDYFWQALALHPGPSVESWSPEDRVRDAEANAAHLVILLGMYGQFPQLQQELTNATFERWSRYTDRREFPFDREFVVFTAMAFADPDRAIAWQAAFEPKLGIDERCLTPQPWISIADVFASNGEDLHKKIAAGVFHLWVIDNEEL